MQTIRPAWIRIPKPGTLDPFSGLTRSKLHELVKLGAVKSRSLKDPDSKRGIRVINADSLDRWIESQ